MRARLGLLPRLPIPVRLALRIVAALVLVAVVYFSVTFVQVWQASRRDDRRPSEAIVVLGAAQYDGRPSAVLAARLDHALDLYEEGVAPRIVVTGGRREGDRFTEAWAGANYLLEHGVPDESILRETGGRSSWESLAASARFLTEVGIEDVTLVSDRFHAARIAAIAEELGLEAAVSPASGSPVRGLSHVRRLVDETLRVGVGRIVGYRRLTRVERVGEVVPGLAILVPVAAPGLAGRGRRRTRSGVV